jgi:hypothetical protein
VVITPLSLPGMRWAQNNGNTFDGRIWQDKAWWNAGCFLLEGPRHRPQGPPGRCRLQHHQRTGAGKEQRCCRAWRHGRDEAAWYAKQADTARDLPVFYDTVIKAIREVDPSTPIMADAGWYAAADAFSYWPRPLSDDRVLYSFHMYEPYAATSAPNMKREKPYAYPGKVPFGENEEQWNGERVAAYLQAAGRLGRQPQRAAQPHGRRRVWLHAPLGGLQDLSRRRADIARRRAKLHWAFYSFREDSWDGMDYELGSKKVHWKYWDAIDAGQPDPVKRKPGPEFDPIRKRL